MEADIKSFFDTVDHDWFVEMLAQRIDDQAFLHLIRKEMRVKHRTARKRLQSACRRIKEWIRDNRHLKGKQFIQELNRRLQGHYNYYGLRGNSESLYRFYTWAKQCAFKWLNRRGGKRKSFTWEAFERALDRLGIALPKITEVKRQHVVYA